MTKKRLIFYWFLAGLIGLIYFCICSQLYAQMLHQKPMHGIQINKVHSLGGPVGFWLKNEGSGNIIQDLSGNGNNGTFGGDTAWVTGQFGPALNFPGTNDYVLVADSPTLRFSSGLTVVCSCKPTTADSSEYFLWKGDQATDLLVIGKSSQGDGRWTFSIHVDSVVGTIRPDTVIPSTTEYSQIVGTRDSTGAMRLYLNGVAFSDTDTQAGAIDTADDLYLGIRSDLSSDWAGDIEYVYIYKRALTTAEVALLYAEPFCMFAQDNITLLEAGIPAPTGGGQIITIIQSTIPLFLIPVIYFIKRRKFNEKML